MGINELWNLLYFLLAATEFLQQFHCILYNNNKDLSIYIYFLFDWWQSSQQILILSSVFAQVGNITKSHLSVTDDFTQFLLQCASSHVPA